MSKKFAQAIAIVTLPTITLGLPIMPIQAENMATELTAETTSEQIGGEQIISACVNNQAEQLPSAFVDVPSDHWAFKAVQTMYYCGAYRQATPIKLQEQLIEQRSLPQSGLPAPKS